MDNLEERYRQIIEDAKTQIAGKRVDPYDFYKACHYFVEKEEKEQEYLEKELKNKYRKNLIDKIKNISITVFEYVLGLVCILIVLRAVLKVILFIF